MRLVKAAAKCKRNETKVSWSVLGPAGPAGAKGETGATGTPDTSNFFNKAESDARFLASGGKAADAEKLDGKDSADFLGATATAADAALLDGLDSTAFLRSTAKATDADLLDGLNSTAFLGVAAKAADSDRLDGFDSTAFAKSGNFRRAVVTSSGGLLNGNGVTVSRTSTGVYRVDLGDLNGACAMAITPENQFAVVRADFVSDPSGFDVRFGTIAASPTPIDVQFQIQAICPTTANGSLAAKGGSSRG